MSLAGNLNDMVIRFEVVALFTVVLPLAAGVAAPVSADTITLATVARGRTSATTAVGGGPTAGYGTGWNIPGSGNVEYRSWFRFDLMSVSGTVDSAVLKITNSATSYNSPDATETYELHEVLLGPPSTWGTMSLSAPAAFADLGDGPVWGTYAFSASDSSTTTMIALNAAGLAGVQSQLGGGIVLGGLITSLTMINGVTEAATLGSSNTTVVLELSGDDLALTQVPEPASLVLFGSGLAAIAARRRRRRTAALGQGSTGRSCDARQS